uniref:Sema domain-containing protein n=1 Tax=Tetranychus urticae TaxID=32264 RepID=A0A158P4Z1_TETUR
MESWDFFTKNVFICLQTLLSFILIQFNNQQITMLIPNLVIIMQFFLSIEYSYSFKRFKQNRLTYYKAPDSVSFRNAENLTWCDIYVAGGIITIETPTSVVNVSDIVNWKVVNLDKNKLMFVHKNKPQIMINQKNIEDMEYSGKLTGSIIAFGDNEALHVPTIFNPNLTEPVPKWNYIELLYFDDQKKSVSAIRFLPMLKDDWKFIKEWKMMDYIHFDDKLYLLIKRSIWNEKAANVTQEISIIRLCLDKGSELISTAIEIRYNRPEFHNNQITGAIFICLTFYKPEKILLLITKEASNKSLIHTRYFIKRFVSLFDKTGQKCASGSNNYTLMRYHLRSEVRSCQKTTYKNCSSSKNTVPSVELNFDRIWPYHFIFADGRSIHPPLEYDYNHSFNQTHFCHQISGWEQTCIEIYKNFNNDSSIQNVQAFFFGYPMNRLWLRYNSLRFIESRRCYQRNNIYLGCYKNDGFEQFIDDMQLHWYSNHRPLGHFQVTKNTNKIILYDLNNFCGEYKSCMHCLMYGVSMDCIWSDSICKKDKETVTQTNDFCFKLARISPLMFNSSSPETLTIELDRPLVLDDTQEYLDIKAGPHNHCINIKPSPSGSIFNCSMRLSESGKFKISVSILNDRFADAISVSALSTEKVDIVVPEDDYLPTVILLFLGLLLISSIVYVRFKKQQSKEPKKVSTRKVRKFSDSKKKQAFAEAITITRVKSQIISSTMQTTKDSTIRKEPSSKLVKSRSSIPSVSKQLDVSKSQNSSLSCLKSTKNKKSTKIAVKSMESKSRLL